MEIRATLILLFSGILLVDRRHDPRFRANKLFRGYPKFKQASDNAGEIFEPKILAVSVGLCMFLEGLVLGKNVVRSGVKGR